MEALIRTRQAIGFPFVWMGLILCMPGTILIMIGQWFQERE